MRASVHASPCVCVCVWMCVGVCMRVRECVLAHTFALTQAQALTLTYQLKHTRMYGRSHALTNTRTRTQAHAHV